VPLKEHYKMFKTNNHFEAPCSADKKYHDLVKKRWFLEQKAAKLGIQKLFF
jgi:hypothetical protein